MIINTNLIDGTTSITSTIEVEEDCLSICFRNNSINICQNNGILKAYIYAGNNDPEIIALPSK